MNRNGGEGKSKYNVHKIQNTVRNEFNKKSSAFISRQLLDLIKRLKTLFARYIMFLDRKIYYNKIIFQSN